MKSLLILLTLMLVATFSYADPVGVRTRSVPSPERGKNLNVTIWYPAQSGGTPTLVGDNKVLKGTPAFANAPLAAGRHPLILFSHGSGGSIETMGWIGTPLVAAGYIVAGPNYPGTISGDSMPQSTPKVWEGAQDLSNVINALTSDAQWKNAIATDRIGVLGFSLGGTTGMLMAGARVNREAYARYCEQNTSLDCAVYAGGKAI